MNLVFASGYFLPQHFAGKDYFRDVREEFPGCCLPSVPPHADIATRARALAEQIHQAFSQGPVHVVAHSMGGLDTRFLLSNNLLGLASAGRIASLSTLATPHKGSPVADLLVGAEPGKLDPRRLIYEKIQELAHQLGASVDALGNLTTGFARRFHCPDVPHVKYFYYAASGNESALLAPTHLYLQTIGESPEEKANDGLVTVASAAGERGLAEPPWDTDHFGEVGYSADSLNLHSAFDHIGAYRRILARAAA
jgi:triacylglycerol lipase